MLAYLAPERMGFAQAVGSSTLAEFEALARVHSDGWGSASEAGRTASPTALVPGTLGALPQARTRLAYLRFASRGAPPSDENTQPFVRDNVAFQHNGALSPVDGVHDLLSMESVAELVGTTDSEQYFALVLQRARTMPLVAAVESAVADLRSAYPAACLNAILLTPEGVVVVQSRGQSRLPLAAFEARGFTPDTLSTGHDDGYNQLYRTTTPDGVVIVATTGVTVDGWIPFAQESVTLLR